MQGHGEDLGALGIFYVRKLVLARINLTWKLKRRGFKSLLNGRDLDHWVEIKPDYIMENNSCWWPPKKRAWTGKFVYAEEYLDFNFRFDFKLTLGCQ